MISIGTPQFISQCYKANNKVYFLLINLLKGINTKWSKITKAHKKIGSYPIIWSRCTFVALRHFYSYIVVYPNTAHHFLLQNNLVKFTTQEHIFKRWFWTQKSVLNVRFTDFWYAKINLIQIWYDEFNKEYSFLHETQIF